MPVQLEMIEQVNAEDLQDLIKIYQDDLNLDERQIEDWLQQQLNNGQRLFAGRFNSRLLGAIWASEQDNQHWRLTQLCVRSITRRRSVAGQLMQLLANHAQKQQLTLTVDAQSLAAELSPLLAELGFEHQHQQWLLAPKSN